MERIFIDDIAKATGGKVVANTDKEIAEIVTDSRQAKPKSLFVAIKGERVDGHDYILQVLNNGASVLSMRMPTEEESKTAKDNKAAIIVIEESLKALKMLAKYVRERFNLPIVGITGSVGKTTTKEMVATALSTKLNTLKTDGNLNSQIGVSIMMSRLASVHEAAVIEMGISDVGEMENLSNIVMPKIAVLTNIGVSHIQQFKTQGNIAAEKLNIIMKTVDKDNAVIVINADDEYLSRIANYKKTGDKSILSDINIDARTLEVIDSATVITYGLKPEYDFYAENVCVLDGEQRFVMVYKGGREDCKLSVLGEHNVYNALAAMAVATFFDIHPSVSKKGLYQYKPLNMRGTIIEKNGYKIIDDTYNASPDSMKSGLKVLSSLEGIDDRIACLADVLELGEMSSSLHYSVGTFIAKFNETNKNARINEVVAIGKESHNITKAISDYEAKTGNSSGVVTKNFDNNEQAIEYFKSRLHGGSGLLCKGSRGMHVDEVVKAL